jgi:hypothetical protein
MKQKLFALVVAAVAVAGSGAAMAADAIDVSGVTDMIGSAQTGGIAIGAAVLTLVAAIAAYRFIRRAL